MLPAVRAFIDHLLQNPPRAAWGGFLRAARTLADQGRFDGFADAAPGAELNAFFRPFAA
jgi:hypothetical protein